MSLASIVRENYKKTEEEIERQTKDCLRKNTEYIHDRLNRYFPQFKDQLIEKSLTTRKNVQGYEVPANSFSFPFYFNFIDVNNNNDTVILRMACTLVKDFLKEHGFDNVVLSSYNHSEDEHNPYVITVRLEWTK